MRHQNNPPTKAEQWLQQRGFAPKDMVDMFARMEFDFTAYRRGKGIKPYLERIHQKVLRDVEELRVRDEFIHEFGFAVLTSEIVDAIRKYGPLVEIGCGTGYWTYEIAKAGIEIVATDKYPPLLGKNHWFKKQWCDIKPLDAVEAVRAHPGANLLTCWPTINQSWATRTLEAFRGAYVLYEGEHRGATADDSFHDMLENEFETVEQISVPQFFGLHDDLVVWRRKRNFGNEGQSGCVD